MHACRAAVHVVTPCMYMYMYRADYRIERATIVRMHAWARPLQAVLLDTLSAPRPTEIKLAIKHKEIATKRHNTAFLHTYTVSPAESAPGLNQAR